MIGVESFDCKKFIDKRIAAMTITIRRAEPGDFEGIQKIYSGPKVIWGTLQLPYPSIEAWRKRMEEQPEGSYKLAAITENNDIVGDLTIHTFPNSPRRRHAGGIGMAVRDDYQGKGVGTALLKAALDMTDNWLNLRRVELQVYSDNQPAVHLYQNFGFIIEGTLVGYAYRAGQFVDVYSMARFKQD
jgi:putative acetyltransferase